MSIVICVPQRRGGLSSSSLSPCGVPLTRKERAAARDADVDVPSVSLITSIPEILLGPAVPLNAHPDAISTLAGTPISITAFATTPSAPAPSTVIGISTPALVIIGSRSNPHPLITTAAFVIIHVTAVIGIAAMSIVPAPSRPVVVGLAGGVVLLSLYLVMWTNCGGVNGGGPADEGAAAKATPTVVAVTTALAPALTTPKSAGAPSSFPWVLIIDSCHRTMHDDSSLLPMTADVIGNRYSSGGSGGVSGIPLGVRRIAVHAQLPPAVVRSGSA